MQLCRRKWRKLGNHIFCSSVHSFGKMSMLLSKPWGGAYLYTKKSEIYLSWKIRVSLSNPKSTSSSLLEKHWSKHQFEAIFWELLILEEHDLEDYVKGEVVYLEGDEDKVKHKENLVKAKRTIIQFRGRQPEGSKIQRG